LRIQSHIEQAPLSAGENLRHAVERLRDATVSLDYA
jgi:hypothetical protein